MTQNQLRTKQVIILHRNFSILTTTQDPYIVFLSVHIGNGDKRI